MLEGLEISEVLLSEIIDDNEEFRLDDDYYRKEYVSIYNLLNNYAILKDLVTMSDVSSNGSFKYVQDILKDDFEKVIPYIRSGNVGDTFINSDDLIKISKEAHLKLRLSRTLLYDVIMARKGKIGGASIITEDEVDFNCNENVIKLTIKNKEKINPFYFVTFFNSKYGLKQIERLSTGNVQPWVSIFQIRKLRLPILSQSFQLQIEQIVKLAHSKLQKSKSLYSEAEVILLSEVGLKNWQPNNTPINIKQLKESFLASGRLDAEYYQPKYEDYATFISNYKGGADALGKVCTLNEKNFNPIENQEYKYIELSNIGNSGEITGCTTSIGAKLPSRARRLVRMNDVIVSSIEGSLQSVALVTDEYDMALCSTGFYVVKSETINPETLLVLFKSEPMQNLLKQGCSGTILTAIGRNELQNIVMPKIRKEVQSEIATYVQKSISLRNEAKQLLESAKLKVEDTISTPPHLIDNQLVIKYNKMTEESTYYYRLAEWTLLQELYAEKWFTTSTANYSIKNYSVCKSSGRLDAEYYQPKYDALFAQLSKYECDTIKDIAHIKKSVEPGSEAYQDSGIPFVRVSDVTKFGISEPNIYLSPSDFNLNELRPKKDTILLSKDGSVGIAYKIEEDIDCITSGALLHLSVFNKDYTPDYLTLVLNSIVVQMQADRDSNGAIIQHWKPSEIEQVIIPKLPKQIQETISTKIQESFALKAESKRLLDEAKMMVEREIGILTKPTSPNP